MIHMESRICRLESLVLCSLDVAGLIIIDNNIGAEGAKYLGDGIKTCTSLTSLYLSCALTLSREIHCLSHSRLDLSPVYPSIVHFFFFSMGDVSVAGSRCWHSSFVPEYPNLFSFPDFNCSIVIAIDNAIGDDGARYVGDGIKTCLGLTTLVLASTLVVFLISLRVLFVYIIMICLDWHTRYGRQG